MADNYKFTDYSGDEMDALFDKVRDLDVATPSESGLMSGTDKSKLDDIEADAQENVLEGVQIAGTDQPISEKKVNIPVDNAPTEGSSALVRSGGVAAALATIRQFRYQVVETLPTASADTMGIIYLVPSENPETENYKDEFITIDNGDSADPRYTWEQIGSTAIDVSGKADKDLDAVEDNLAKFDANGNPVDSGISAGKIDEIEGKITTLGNSAGIAEGIADTISAGTEQEFTFRKSGGDGVNYIKKIKGKTIVVDAQLASNDAEAVETTGRNQYNPATGKAQVIGGTTYYIGGTYTSLSQGGVAITPAGDGTFTPASTGEVEVVGGNATDTIINISDADNGLWQPYWKRTLQLALTTKEDTDGNVPFADGMKGDGWTHADECDKNGGRILIRKVVFDGREAWSYAAGSFLYSLPVSPLLTNITNRGYGLSNKFGTNTPATGFPSSNTWDITDYRVGFNHSLVPALAESTNPQDWKDWLAAQYANGTPLEMVYAIATPVPFTWAEPLPNAILVDSAGTEQAVYPVHEDGTPSAPFKCDSNYSISIKNLLAKLSE